MSYVCGTNHEPFESDPDCAICQERQKTTEEKVNEIHAMLSEIMPHVRRAARLMDTSVAVRIRESMKRRG